MDGQDFLIDATDSPNEKMGVASDVVDIRMAQSTHRLHTPKTIEKSFRKVWGVPMVNFYFFWKLLSDGLEVVFDGEVAVLAGFTMNVF